MTRFVRLATPVLMALAVSPTLATAQARLNDDVSRAAASAAVPATPVAAVRSAVVPPLAAPEHAANGVAVAIAATDAPRGPIVATAGVRANRAEPRALPAPPKREDTSRNRAMIIVGGAALIVGALVGDDAGRIIMVGGAGLGLYGLYRYLE